MRSEKIAMIVAQLTKSQDLSGSQYGTMVDSLGEIDSQQFDRCGADRSLAAKNCPVPTKVFFPSIYSRIEQSHNFIRTRWMSGDVAPLECITPCARPAEILKY
jgi:hypothetical protein